MVAQLAWFLRKSRCGRGRRGPEEGNQQGCCCECDKAINPSLECQRLSDNKTKATCLNRASCDLSHLVQDLSQTFSGPPEGRLSGLNALEISVSTLSERCNSLTEVSGREAGATKLNQFLLNWRVQFTRSLGKFPQDPLVAAD